MPPSRLAKGRRRSSLLNQLALGSLPPMAALGRRHSAAGTGRRSPPRSPARRRASYAEADRIAAERREAEMSVMLGRVDHRQDATTHAAAV